MYVNCQWISTILSTSDRKMQKNISEARGFILRAGSLCHLPHQGIRYIKDRTRFGCALRDIMTALIPLLALLFCIIAVTLCFHCKMEVKVTSNTEKKFKAVVTVPALGIRSQPMIFKGKTTKKIKVDGEDCGAKPWIIKTYQWKNDHWKAAKNMTAKLAGDGFIRFKVGDDLMPRAGDRLGIMCSEGSCG
ncbi:unnamed protein product [Cylicostephanus goldi]|uniref:Uncharacterized protein n=1 Tax=Cylicostephanus goldi TaxID=71465 RepID=A0A3P7PX08_CYLGO|nr:unnamed protein product [Cylicostephanus goldi]